MQNTVPAVMRSIHNFFETGYRKTTYQITGGAVSPGEGLCVGQWIAIEGSGFHDGVWLLGEGLTLTGAGASLPDESFCGKLWYLHPPNSFLALCEEIAAYRQKSPSGPYQSEAFGEYSYTRASGKNGGVLTWEEAFASSLSPYRRMYTEVNA